MFSSVTVVSFAQLHDPVANPLRWPAQALRGHLYVPAGYVVPECVVHQRFERQRTYVARLGNRDERSAQIVGRYRYSGLLRYPAQVELRFFYVAAFAGGGEYERPVFAECPARYQHVVDKGAHRQVESTPRLRAVGGQTDDAGRQVNFVPCERRRLVPAQAGE